MGVGLGVCSRPVGLKSRRETSPTPSPSAFAPATGRSQPRNLILWLLLNFLTNSLLNDCENFNNCVKLYTTIKRCQARKKITLFPLVSRHGLPRHAGRTNRQR